MEDLNDSRAAALGQIIQLVRLAILCMLAAAALLLVADFAGRGWNDGAIRFLSENVLMTIVYAISGEVIAAIAAASFLALWKR